MSWLIGGWPPPPPGDGTVTFEAVRDALALADSAVGFNNQSLQGVADVNNVEMAAGNDKLAMSIGDTGSGNPLTVNRIAIGADVLAAAASTALDCIAIGNGSQRLVTTGDSNVSVGHGSLDALTTGSDNTAFGHASASAVVLGVQNTALGSGALELGTTPSRSVAIGYRAGRACAGADNVFVDQRAGELVDTGTNNVVVGQLAAASLTTGTNNVAVGQQAGGALTVEAQNTFIGAATGVGSVASGEVLIGYAAVALDLAGANGLSIKNVIWGDLTRPR